MDITDFDCMDCGKNTLECYEFYILQHDLWKRICPHDYKGMLCLDCAETRLGRPFENSDFIFCENVLRCTLKVCPELKRRLYRSTEFSTLHPGK